MFNGDFGKPITPSEREAFAREYEALVVKHGMYVTHAPNGMPYITRPIGPVAEVAAGLASALISNVNGRASE
jgi:hypothetical protein